MTKSVNLFSNVLITWYLKNKRELPWRQIKYPYAVWLSEIILQQTRVAQGLPYYLRFVEAFPTVFDLANAPEEDVLKLWQGLGYYSRARNLHASAKYISNELNGEFPKNYKDLLKLKGVGDYTASAISSICYNEKQAVVDGNVYRVLARYFDIDTPINSTAGKAEFRELAQSLIDVENPGTYNQAIMEFGARQCTPQSPDCSICVLNDSCLALKHKKVSELPVKIKGKPIKNRYFNYMVVLSSDAVPTGRQEKTILQQRTGKGIWQQLYEFPLIESTSEVDLNELKNLQQFKEFSENLDILSIIQYNEVSKTHKLSHQHLHTKFWIVEVANSEEENMISTSTLKEYAVPVLIADFVAEFFDGQYVK